MPGFTGFAASPVPAQPSEESVRLVKRLARNRRMSERVKPTGMSLRMLRLTMTIAGYTGRAPAGAREVRYGQVRGRLLPGTDPDGVLLWVHGGGFVSGTPRTDQGLVAMYRDLAGLSVFTPYYRLAPEHPFPAAADDVLDAYIAMLHQGFPAEQIRIGGVSSGGALVTGLLGDVARGGLPVPARVLLLSPLLDLSVRSARRRDEVQPDPFVSPEFIDRTTRAYLAGAALSDPRLDLLAADMRTWPPVLVQTGGLECIAEEAERLGTAMRAAGAHCAVQIWPGQAHGFYGFGRKTVPEARAAVEYAARFLAATRT
jgi:monoterpene epsilon-lactone hydrolase